MAKGDRLASVALVAIGIALAMIVPPVAGIIMDYVLDATGWAKSSKVESGSGIRGDDDGELHDGWDASMGYSSRSERYRKKEDWDSSEYGVNIALDIDISYPVFSGTGEHNDALNEAVRDAAMAFYDDYVEHPSKEAIEMIASAAEFEGTGSAGRPAMPLRDEVTYAITYNNANFVSVSFSDICHVGSYSVAFISLRCVNMNLKTGELYDVDDVLKIDEPIANAFVDALVANAGEDTNEDGVATEDECYSVNVIGREEWVRALMGEGQYVSRISPTFFVDEKGRVNLAASYGLSGDKGIIHGWWDATLSDELLDGNKLDSSFWGVLEKATEDS